ncbi:MAG: hypothetical protein EBZ95_13890 [Chitinophagia bacterium]|nr:hypothetical protein [Chitinophagia bacterium]
MTSYCCKKFGSFCEWKNPRVGFGEPLVGYCIDLLDANWLIVLIACLQKLIERVDNGVRDFVTDEWNGFFRIFPEERYLFGKDLT